MAEVTGLRNNALPYPIYGVPFGVSFPILDADGDPVTGAAALDSERSLNGDTFADCTNEATEIATSSGIYYLLLTGAEMTADVVTVIVKTTTSGAKTTVLTLYPRKLVSLRAGTSQTGAAGSITLDASASAVDDYYNGCVCVAVIDTLTEARVISDYVGSTKVASVSPNWNVTPDSDDTFTIYLTEGRQIPQSDNVAWLGTAIAAADTAGYPKVTIKDGTGTGEIDTTSGGVLVAAIAANAINAAAIATDAITNAKIAADAIGAAEIADGAIDANTFAAGAINAAAIAADAIGASELAADAVAEIADAVWDEAMSGHLTLGTYGQVLRAHGLTGEVNTGAASTTSFAVDGFTEATADHFNGSIMVFTSGACLGQARVITDYSLTTQVVTLAEALTDAPADNDDFVIVPGAMPGGTLSQVFRLFLTLLSASGEIQATTLASDTIAAAKIAAGAITAAKFAAGAIDAAAIATDAIGAAELADGAITAGTFAAGAIDATAIGADAITNAKIADDAIAVENIKDAAITAAKIAADAITAAKIAADAIGASELATGAVDEIVDAVFAELVGGASFAAHTQFQTDSLAATTVATIADGVWDEAESGHVAAGSFGQANQAVFKGAVASGASGTVTLGAASVGTALSAVDDYYNGLIVMIVAGLGVGQFRAITDYVGATKVATVDGNWATVPDSTSKAIIVGV